MAKNKEDSVSTLPAATNSGVKSQAELQAEIDRLRGERDELLARQKASTFTVDNLRSQLAAKDKGVSVQGPASLNVSDGTERYWRIELEHAPSLIVPATDPANARDVYMRRLGVTATEYEFKVHTSSRDEYLQQERRLASQSHPRTLPRHAIDHWQQLGIMDAQGEMLPAPAGAAEPAPIAAAA